MTMEAAELLESVREELRGLASPWRTRRGAADYLGCTEGWIDTMVAAGELKRHYLGNSPRFLVKDLDALVTDEKRNFKQAA